MTNDTKFSDEMIEEMREWIADCEWADITEDDIPELTPAEIVRAVRKNYDGGLIGFVRGSVNFDTPENQHDLDAANDLDGPSL